MTGLEARSWLKTVLRQSPATGSSTIRAVFIGKTGVGKSSLINALFGLHLITDDAAPGTRAVDVNRIEIAGSGPGNIPVDIVDTPGFSESRETDSRYRRLYAAELPKADHLIWTVQAHPRVFRPDQVALQQLGRYIKPTCAVTVAMTHIDTLGPNDWDDIKNSPSVAQLKAIGELATSLEEKFSEYLGISAADIVPCSSTRNFGLDALRLKIALSNRVNKRRAEL